MGGPSLYLRSLIAVALMFGFYLLAFGIVGGLLYLPYLEFTVAERVHGKLVLGCIVAAGVILWSILPRRDKFEPPGPELRPGHHPNLFREVRAIAAATQQEMPREVYLVPDMNAWVAQRGGVMGIGSRRVMGIGLPLLQALSVSQFRAVLAHEFGHYHGGDTALGPWVYKTRNALRRTVRNLVESESVLAYPFIWYGNMFLAVTQAISRAQELAADALAARVVGAPHLADGLVAVHAGALATPSYWNDEIAPILEAGYRPPLAAGFARFVSAETVRKALDENTQQELKAGKGDKYDSHPPLRERVAALRQAAGKAEPARSEPAVSLLGDQARAEQELLRFMMGDAAAKLAPLSWEETGTKVYLPNWRTFAAEHHALLAKLTPEQLPGLADRFAPLFGPAIQTLNPQQGRQLFSELRGVSAGLALAVLDTGGELHALPGECYVEKNGVRLEPFTILPRLANGELTPEDWRRQCAAIGIAGRNLAAPAARPATASP